METSKSLWVTCSSPALPCHSIPMSFDHWVSATLYKQKHSKFRLFTLAIKCFISFYRFINPFVFHTKRRYNIKLLYKLQMQFYLEITTLIEFNWDCNLTCYKPSGDLLFVNHAEKTVHSLKNTFFDSILNIFHLHVLIFHQYKSHFLLQTICIGNGAEWQTRNYLLSTKSSPAVKTCPAHLGCGTLHHV